MLNEYQGRSIKNDYSMSISQQQQNSRGMALASLALCYKLDYDEYDFQQSRAVKAAFSYSINSTLETGMDPGQVFEWLEIAAN